MLFFSKKLTIPSTKGFSIALMIDQRVSEGIKLNFFGQPASTTTIPAQLAKKFNCRVVPIYIERIDKFKYKMKINRPIKFEKIGLNKHKEFKRIKKSWNNHTDPIRKFGRYPHRNKVLKRKNTPAEHEYLNSTNYRFFNI